MKPPLKWVGGKAWAVPILTKVWKSFKKPQVCELFAGGSAFSFALGHEHTILNDINPHLINYYRWLREGLVISDEVAFKNTEDKYYKIREIFNILNSNGFENSRFTAILFYYLNKTGYRGLYRINKSGGFNVPYGNYKKIGYVYNFLPHKDMMETWQLSCKDFRQMDVPPNYLIYADPPYHGGFTGYNGDTWIEEDTKELIGYLTLHAGPAALSYKYSDWVIDLLKKYGWNVGYYDAPRGFHEAGSIESEIIATKPPKTLKDYNFG